MRWRWPLARASTVRMRDTELGLALDHLDRLQIKCDGATRGAVNASRRRDEAIRECANIARDLKLIRMHIERNGQNRTVFFGLELADEVIVRGYRHNVHLHEVLAMAIGEQFHRSDVGRELIRGGSRP
jgi:hypothetical protein